jgi:hypothetical protein
MKTHEGGLLMEVIGDWAERHAAQCVALAIEIRCQPCNQETVANCFRNDLQALVYSCFLKPSQ